MMPVAVTMVVVMPRPAARLAGRRLAVSVRAMVVVMRTVIVPVVVVSVLRARPAVGVVAVTMSTVIVGAVIVVVVVRGRGGHGSPQHYTN